MVVFVLQVMITFIAVDAFDLVDLEHYDLPVAFDLLNMGAENMKLDYKFAVQLTQEILILELVHRCKIVRQREIFFLQTSNIFFIQIFF